MAKDFEEIRSDVVQAGGVKCVSMHVLRDASPYRRLGSGVSDEISESLRQKSLGHSPSPLPVDAGKTVYVYEIGGEAGRLIDAITGGAPSDEGAKSILSAVGTANDEDGVAAKVEEIRALAVQLNDILGEEPGETGAPAA